MSNLRVSGFRGFFGGVTAVALVSAVGCTTLETISADVSVTPSSRPVTAENVRGGRLAAIGAQQHPRILAAYGGEYSDVKLERMVANIVGRLVTVSDNPSQVYQISILDSPVINAFALPGGYLYVSRGLLALANDGAELAAVIAHEMAHVTAQHGIKRQRKEEEAVLASRVVTEVLADKNAGRRALARGKVALAQFSRNQELEADAIGISALNEAGFDPYAAARFQQTMDAFSKLNGAGDAADNSLDFLSTHPSTPQRIQLALGHARKYGAPGSGDADRESYLLGLDGMLFGDSPNEGYVRDQTYAHVGLGIALDFPPGFQVENRPEAVLGARPDGAAIRFDGADVPANQPLATYLASGWVEGLDASTVRATRINGLDAATARALVGRWAFDITVFRVGSEVYRILTAVPAPGSELEALANEVRSTFRALSEAESASFQPLRVRIVRADEGETVEQLARRMNSFGDSEGAFRIFNGMNRADRVVPGQLYKIVSQ
ncbi:MAG: M48 family metalloprotease [Pseudomonadota bacterium]